jgi:malonyl-CoA O-methyltransferase
MTIDKIQVARQFSRAATQYDEFAIVQKEMANRLLTQLKPNAKGELIDLGCGTGLALEIINRQTDLTLTGLDLAPAMLKVAQARVPRANFVIGDLEQTQLAGDRFDFVFSNAALQWCHLGDALAEMYRLLRPDGQLLLGSFGKGTLAEWETAWRAVDPNRPRVHPFPDEEKLQTELANAGFTSINLTSTTRTFTFDSVDHTIASIRKIGASYADDGRAKSRLTRRMYQQFREALANTPADKTQLSYRCLLVTANA